MCHKAPCCKELMVNKLQNRFRAPLSDTFQNLEALLAERIVFMDGGMGTMLQRYKLEESDFRGERFKDHPGQLKGNNDLLSLTQPDIIREVHQHVQRYSNCDG